MAVVEEKKYLINVDSNLDDYTYQVKLATIEVDKLKEAQKDAEKQFGKNSKEYIIATAELKEAQKAQKQATTTLEKMTAAQKSNGNSYNALQKQWDAAQLKLKALENTLVQNADGTFELTEEYKKAAIEVANAKNALNNFTTGVKDGRNNVGLYGDAIKDAFGGLGGQLSSAIPGFDKLQQGIQTAKIGFTSLKGAIMATGIGALVLALVGLFQYFTKTKEGATFLSKATAALGAAFDTLMAIIKPLGSWLVSIFTEPKKALKDLGDFLYNQIIVRFNGFKKILSGIMMTLKGDFKGGLKAIGEGASDAVTGVENFRAKVEALGKAAIEAAKAAAALAQAQADLAQQNVDASYTLAQLSKQAETYRAIADDDTRSFAEREKAAEKADVANRQMMAMRVKLTREAFRIAELELEQQKKAGKDTIEIQQKAADSYAALKEAETAYNTSVITLGMNRRKIESDLLELRLDSIEKGLDGIKAANTSAINDDKKTVAERRIILEALTQTRDKALADEIKLIEQFSGKQIDLADLVATKDAVILKQKLDGYQLSEKATIRLQDVVKNAQDTNTEFADLQKSLDEKALARKVAFTAKEKELIDSISNTNRESINKIAADNIELNAKNQTNLANQTIKNADELNFRLQEIEIQKQQALRDIQINQQLETDTILEQQRNEKTIADIENMQIEQSQKNQLLIDAEAQNAANLQAIQVNYDMQRKLNAAQTEAEITANQKLELSLRQKALEGSLNVASSVFGQMSELAGKQTELGKAFAITQAIINTYSSAVAAYNSAAAVPVVGWVLGPIAAAGAIAAGLKNVAEIRKAGKSGSSGGGSASGGGGKTVSSSFTAANQQIAQSQTQNANADRLGTIQQNVNNQTALAQTAQATAQPQKVEVALSVEAFESQAAKKNQVEVKSNI